MGEQPTERIALKEGLWTMSGPEGPPFLTGSSCIHCGEIYFPIKPKGWCVHCQRMSLNDVLLSRRGRVASISIAEQKPGGGFYHGDVPYAYGLVDLPEGLRLVTQFKAENLPDIRVGDEVEFVLDRLYRDAKGREVITYKFQKTS